MTDDVRAGLRDDLDRVAAATARLVLGAELLDDEALAGPSLLPGWSRAHVLGHIARNAEGMLRLVDWALTGQPSPMYRSGEARAEGIEEAAALPGEELRALLLDSATTLGDALVRLRDADDEALGRLLLFGVPAPGAVPDVPAHQLAWARLREVEIHHLDLDAGYGALDWPEDFVVRLAAFLDSRSPTPAVVGDPAEVLAWRLGRGAAPGVRGADGGDPGDPGAW